jgi:SAM-dependent methyltransferase
MRPADLTSSEDFAFGFAVVHEMPSASSFFAELSRALKPGGSILFAEPAGRVKAALWDAELEAAATEAGLSWLTAREFFAVMLFC